MFKVHDLRTRGCTAMHWGSSCVSGVQHGGHGMVRTNQAGLGAGASAIGIMNACVAAFARCLRVLKPPTPSGTARLTSESSASPMRKTQASTCAARSTSARSAASAWERERLHAGIVNAIV